MKNEFVPGPYSLRHPSYEGEVEEGFVILDAPSHGHMASILWLMEEDSLAETPRNSPQQEATARLLAAAPDLYEALILAKEYLDEILSSDSYCLQQINAALDKVKGKDA